MGCCGPWGLPSPPKHATENLKLTEYLQKSRDERTSHVNLSTPCVVDEEAPSSNKRAQGKRALLEKLSLEDDVENWVKGKVHVCHLCERHSANGWCSNPLHLYLGTPRENKLDTPQEVRVEAAKRAAEAAHQEKNEEGKSVNAVKRGKKGAKAAHKKKNEEGKSVNAVRSGRAAHREKNKEGKSVNAVKASEAAHKNKDEFGRSLSAVKGSEVGAVLGGVVSGGQKWVSLVDGLVGNSGAVAVHNRAVGGDPSDRAQLSDELAKQVAPRLEALEFVTYLKSGKARRRLAQRVPEDVLQQLRSGVRR